MEYTTTISNIIYETVIDEKGIVQSFVKEVQEEKLPEKIPESLTPTEVGAKIEQLTNELQMSLSK